MTGTVPPPLAPTAAAAVGNQPLADAPLAPGRSCAPGQPVSAVVVAMARSGATIEIGGQRFLVSGAPPLPQGATLSLDLPGAGRQDAPGRLLAIAGQALEPPVAIRLQPAPSPIAGREPAASPPVATGVEVDARLLGPDGRPAGPPVSVRLTALPAAGQVPDGTRPAATGQAASASPDLASPAGGAMTAEVIERDPAGRPLLRAAGLMLRLESALDVPLGARLQVLLPPASGQPAPAAGGDALQRAISALLRPSAPADAGAPLGLRLPAADHALAARLLRWIEAIGARAGSSDVAAAAGADAPDAGALRSALHELGQEARAPQAGAWRVLVMPFGVEDPRPLRLYLRDPEPDQERGPRPGRERRSGARRAIFEVELSELGRCQLDVLCQARRFDLAVRTERPLAAALQDDIRGLLQAACELAGVAGKVDFRAAELLRLPDPHAPAGRSLMA